MLNRLFSILLTAFVVFTIATPVHASGEGEDVDYGAQVMHHISDANEFHFWGDIHILMMITRGMDMKATIMETTLQKLVMEMTMQVGIMPTRLSMATSLTMEYFVA